MKTYYIVVYNNSPVDVTPSLASARTIAAQWSVTGKPAQVVPVTPVQTEFEFADEEPTKPAASYNTGCVLGEGCLNNNYEVGSGARCGGCGK